MSRHTLRSRLYKAPDNNLEEVKIDNYNAGNFKHQKNLLNCTVQQLNLTKVDDSINIDLHQSDVNLRKGDEPGQLGDRSLSKVNNEGMI